MARLEIADDAVFDSWRGDAKWAGRAGAVVKGARHLHVRDFAGIRVPAVRRADRA